MKIVGKDHQKPALVAVQVGSMTFFKGTEGGVYCVGLTNTVHTSSSPTLEDVLDNNNNAMPIYIGETVTFQF